MAMTVNDVRDFLHVLREHPEWRAAVRQEVLGEELLSLPDLVRRNSLDIAELREAVAQNSRDIAELREVVAQNSRDIQAMIVVQDRHLQQTAQLVLDSVQVRADITEMRGDIAEMRRDITEMRGDIAEMRRDMTEMRGDIAEMRGDIKGLKDDVGGLHGEMIEVRFTLKPSRIIPAGRIRKPRVVDAFDLDDLSDAFDAGLVTSEEREMAFRTDLLVLGGDGSGAGAADVLLVVELSRTIDQHDIERAASRAAILRKAGYRAVAAVGGRMIDPRERRLADDSGVEVYLTAAAG